MFGWIQIAIIIIKQWSTSFWMFVVWYCGALIIVFWPQYSAIHSYNEKQKTSFWTEIAIMLWSKW